jgi:glyoxylase-like metal-dependent hydrolase (beta-lactamase superfamily II)
MGAMVSEASKIQGGVHLVDGMREANSYLLVADGGLTVIDAGLSGGERIVKYARENGFSADQIRTIILTHSDIDHAGGVSRLKEMTGARVAIHEADAARLSGEKPPKAAKGALGALMKMAGGLMKFKPVKPDVLLKEGDKISGLTVIHTPGHTEGSISLLTANGVLFVGDALRTGNDGKPRLSSDAFNIDSELAKESVKKLSVLEFSALLPGHGPPIMENASALVRELVASDFR